MLSKFKSLKRLTWSLVVGLLANGAQGAELHVVKYSKQELNATKEAHFIKSRDFSDIVSENFRNIMVTLTNRQSGSNMALRDLVNSAAEPSKSSWQKRQAALASDSESSKVDENRLRLTMSQQTRKAAEINFKNAFPIFERIRSGLTFNLDLKKARQASASDANHIRYGLVEKDILPSQSALAVATLGSISDVDHRYTSPAKVIYTIDRLEGGENRRVFADESDESSADAHTFWRKLPSANMTIKVDAAENDVAMSDQLAQGAAARVTISQFDGLVSTQFVAGRQSFEKTLTTEFKAPLYGSMILAQKFNSDLTPAETAALNLMGDNAAPHINMLYGHKTKKFKGELTLERSGFKYSLVAEPRAGWAVATDPKLGTAGDKLSMALQTNF